MDTFIKLVDTIDCVKMEKALYYNIIVDKNLEHWTFELNEWIYVADFFAGFFWIDILSEPDVVFWRSECFFYSKYNNILYINFNLRRKIKKKITKFITG